MKVTKRTLPQYSTGGAWHDTVEAAVFEKKWRDFESLYTNEMTLEQDKLFRAYPGEMEFTPLMEWILANRETISDLIRAKGAMELSASLERVWPTDILEIGP